jgi:hypothetical protein
MCYQAGKVGNKEEVAEFDVLNCELLDRGRAVTGQTRLMLTFFLFSTGLNYFAFDVIGSLAFGRPFGMLTSGKDIAPVKLEGSNETTYLPAVQILNDRGEYSATMGVMRPWMRCVSPARRAVTHLTTSDLMIPPTFAHQTHRQEVPLVQAW